MELIFFSLESRKYRVYSALHTCFEKNCKHGKKFFSFLIQYFLGNSERELRGSPHPCRERHPTEEPVFELHENGVAYWCGIPTCTDCGHNETSHKVHGWCRQIYGKCFEVYELRKSELPNWITEIINGASRKSLH